MPVRTTRGWITVRHGSNTADQPLYDDLYRALGTGPVRGIGVAVLTFWVAVLAATHEVNLPRQDIDGATRNITCNMTCLPPQPYPNRYRGFLAG